MTLKCATLREELHTELERMLNDIIKFKIHVQESLEAYEEFVASEVEHEVEEQAASNGMRVTGGYSANDEEVAFTGDEMER